MYRNRNHRSTLRNVSRKGPLHYKFHGEVIFMVCRCNIIDSGHRGVCEGCIRKNARMMVIYYKINIGFRFDFPYSDLRIQGTYSCTY